MLLAGFLGTFGIHKFFLGDTKRGLLMLLMAFPGGVLIVPIIISFIWGGADCFRLLVMTEVEFQRLYPEVRLQAQSPPTYGHDEMPLLR